MQSPNPDDILMWKLKWKNERKFLDKKREKIQNLEEEEARKIGSCEEKRKEIWQ
mgnify:CR=1 FL=1